MSDINIDFKCKRCSCVKYSVHDGFIFCSDCGLQAEQIFEHDDFGIAGGRGQSTKFQEKPKPTKPEEDEAFRITSWEGYNYILKGLTDQLVELTGNQNIRMTVLQIWSRILQFHEIAFFNKEKPVLPRMPAVYHFTDAQVLYNFKKRQPKKRVRRAVSRSTSVTSDTRRAKRRRLTKLIDESQRSEYSQIDTHDATIQSLADMSASDFQALSEVGSQGSSRTSIDLEFSQPAMQVLKNAISDDDHISEHESDYDGSMKCHKLSTTNTVRKTGAIYHQLLPSPNLLLVILYLALNHNESQYQISDLVTLCNSHTLPFNDTGRFIPNEIAPEDVAKITKTFNLTSIVKKTADTIIERSMKVSKLIGYNFKIPNILNLCQRYCCELALPVEVFELIQRLIQLKPPKFHQQKRKTISYTNYFFEGRAVAYIIFVLKLLFGLNGVTEVKMSKSISKINKLSPGTIKLFDFLRWVEYIEMRKQLVMKVHTPTHQSNQTGAQKSTAHFLHMMQKVPFANEESDDEANLRSKKPLSKADKTKHNYFDNLTKELLANVPKKQEETILMDFRHSLTPFTSYLLEIKSARPEIVPDRLYENFNEDNIFFLFKPLRLRMALAEKKIALKVKKAPINENIKYQNIHTDQKYLERNRFSNNFKYVKVKAKGDAADWETLVKEEDVNERNRLNLEQEQIHASLKKDFDQLKEEALLRISRAQEERRRKRWGKRALIDNSSDEEKESTPRCFLVESDTDDENLTAEQDCKLKTTLYTPNFNYWTYFYVKRHDRDEFAEIQKKFPDSFNWLLNECAAMLGTKNYTLFHELQIIEAEFNYHMKPLVPGKEPKFYNIEDLNGKIRTAVKNCVERW